MTETRLTLYVPKDPPALVFQRFGLKTRGKWREPEPVPAYADLSPAARFRSALEDLGGLYAEFAHFLAWRADLLKPDYLARMRQVRVAVPPVPLGEVTSALSRACGDAGSTVAPTLRGDAVWSTLARCAYLGEYQGRKVVVQLVRESPPEAAFDDLTRHLRQIAEEPLEAALRDGTLDEFRRWYRLSDSADRERSYLESLGAARDRTLAVYPVLVPELSAGPIVTLEWQDGEPLAVRVARGDRQAVERAAEFVIEQVTTVLAVDGDLDADLIVIRPDGRIGLRRASRLVAVPPSLGGAALKYLSAVLAANAPAAAHLLVKLATGQTDLHHEEKLMDELSNLEPELKINLQFPASAQVFEGNWRSLARTLKEIPLYLHCLHRNLVAVGYWNAEAAPGSDLLAGAQWPVLSRMLRTRLGELMSRESLSDWAIGSGLLLFEGFRQMNRFAEQLRENEISVGVDLQRTEESTHSAHKSIRMGVFIGMLLISFLVSLRLAWTLPSPWTQIFSAVAGGAGIGLFWFVSRMD